MTILKEVKDYFKDLFLEHVPDAITEEDVINNSKPIGSLLNIKRYNKEELEF